MADRTVSVRLRMLVTEYTDGARRARRETASLLTEIDRLREKSPQAYADITEAIGGTGLAMAAVAGYAAKMGMDFDKQMSAVGAATKAAAGDMELLRQAALDAGRATQYSATEAAKAQTELAKAGVATSDILSGGLKGALDLAAAGQMDVAEAAETAAVAMTQFGLKGKDLPHVADLLAAAAGNAQGEVHDMGYALKQSGLVASQFGLSIEETTGALAAFASAGMIGSDAGTSLKTMLLMLANPSKEAAAVMRELGINAYDTQGRFVGLKDLAGQLQRGMAGLTQAQRDQAMATIFGSDAIRGANVLYRQGSAGVQEWTDKVDQAGYASDTAAKKTDNLAGDLERLKGAIETLAIESGSGAGGALRALTQGATNLVNAVSLIPGPIQSGIVAIAGISGVALLAAAGMMRLRQTTGEALAGLAGAGPAGAKFASGVDKAIGVVGKLTAALAAMQIASAAIGDSAAPGSMAKLNKDLVEFGKSGKQAGEVAEMFGDDMEQLKYDLTTIDTGWWSDFNRGWVGVVEGMTGLGSVFDESLQHATERLSSLDQALTQLAASGKADEAAAAFKRLQDVAKEEGISRAELLKAMPQYAASLDDAAAASDLAGAAAERQATRVDMLSMSLSDAISKAGGFEQAFDSLNGTLLASLDAEIAAEQAIDDLTDSLAQNGNQWDLNSESGRANTRALAEGIEKARDAAQKKLEEGASVEQVSATYQGYLARLRETAGGNVELRAEIDRLIAKYGQVPGNIHTTVTVDTAAARAALKSLEGTINALRAQGASTSQWASAFQTTMGAVYGRRSMGGPILGPGTETSDSIPMLLSRGEHVWTAAEVRAAGGHAAVEALRASVLGGRTAQVGQPAAAVTGGGAVYAPTYHISVSGVVSQDAGAQVVEAIRAYERTTGAGWRESRR